MATIVTKTIGTSGRDYSTITAWEADCPSDLVAVNQIWQGVCYNDSAFNEQVTISGPNTNGSCYIWLTVASGHRHLGTKTGASINYGGAAKTGNLIACIAPYTVVQWLRITNCTNTTDDTVITAVRVAGASSCTIDKVYVHDITSVTGSVHPNRNIYGFWDGDGGGMTVNDCIADNLTVSNTTYGNTCGIRIAYGTIVNNCMVYNCGQGIYATAGTLYLFNNICAGNLQDFGGNTMDSSSSGNISSDATAPAYNIYFRSKTAASLWTTPGTNYVLKRGSYASRYGVYRSNAYLTTTVYGETRPGSGTWDIGSGFATGGSVVRTVGTGTAVTKTGTINALAGPPMANKILVGSGTTFLSDYATNDVIIINNYAYRIATVGSNTSITLYQDISVDITAGSAHAKAGTQRDYKTLVDFQAAVPSNLVTADQQWTADVYNDSIFTEGYSHGKVSDLTRYTLITAPVGQRHNGQAYSSAGVRISPTAFRHCFNMGTSGGSSFCIVEYMQCIANQDGSVTPFSNLGAGSGDALLARNNIVYHRVASSPTSIGLYGGNCKAYNNIIYGLSVKGIQLIAGAVAYNNTLYISGNTYGIRTESASCTIQNNAIFTTAGPCFDLAVVPTTENYNIISDTLVGRGAKTIVGASAANTFTSITGGSEDFRLKAGSLAIKTGTSSVGGLFTNDINNYTRSTTWDIGAVKYVNPLQAYTKDFNDSFIGMGVARQNRSIGTRASQTTGTAAVDASGYIVTLTGATFANWDEGCKITVGGDVNYIACTLLKCKLGVMIGAATAAAVPYVAGEVVEFDGGMQGEYVSDDGVYMYIKYATGLPVITVDAIRVLGLASGAMCEVVAIENSDKCLLQGEHNQPSSSGLAYTIEHAYSTPTAWESGEQADLTSLLLIKEGVLYNETWTGSPITISGWTVSRTYWYGLKAAVGQGHGYKTTTGACFNFNAGSGIALPSYFRLEGLRITNWTGGAINPDGTSTGGEIWVVNCVIYTSSGSSNATSGFYQGTEYKNFYFSGCVFYDIDCSALLLYSASTTSVVGDYDPVTKILTINTGSVSATYVGMVGNYVRINTTYYEADDIISTTQVRLKTGPASIVAGASCIVRNNYPVVKNCTIYKCNKSEWAFRNGTTGSMFIFNMVSLCGGYVGSGTKAIETVTYGDYIIISDDQTTTTNYKHFRRMIGRQFISETDYSYRDGTETSQFGVVQTRWGDDRSGIFTDGFGRVRPSATNWDCGHLHIGDHITHVRTGTWTGTVKTTNTVTTGQCDVASNVVTALGGWTFDSAYYYDGVKAQIGDGSYYVQSWISSTQIQMRYCPNYTNRGFSYEGSNVVGWVSGDTFDNYAFVNGASIVINSVTYTISRVSSARTLLLTGAPGTQSGVTYTANKGSYTTVGTWESGQQAHLRNLRRFKTCKLFKDATWATGATVAGWNTSWIYGIKFSGGDKHTGVKDTGVKFDMAGGSYFGVIQQANTVWEDLEFTNWASGYGAFYLAPYGITGEGTAKSEIRRCIFRDAVAGSGGTAVGIRFHNGDEADYCYAHDNILYECGTGISMNTTRCWLKNNTIYKCSAGVYQGQTTNSGFPNSVCFNNISCGCTTYDWFMSNSVYVVGGNNAWTTGKLATGDGTFLKYQDAVNIGVVNLAANYTVTFVSGNNFSNLAVNDTVYIGSGGSSYVAATYTITALPSSLTMAVTPSLTTQSNYRYTAKHNSIPIVVVDNFVSTTSGSEDLHLKATAPVRYLGYSL